MEIVISWRFTFTGHPALQIWVVQEPKKKKKTSQMQGKSGPFFFYENENQSHR